MFNPESNNFESCIHLNVHSLYSLQRSTMTVEDIVRQARAFNMPAVAVTDYSNVSGAVELQIEADKAGIKPIFGSICRLDKHGSIIVLASNQKGYSNLCSLSSMENSLEYPQTLPLDMNFFSEHSEGLILISPYHGGSTAGYVGKGENSLAQKEADMFITMVGKDNFYIEIMSHNDAEEKKIFSDLCSFARENSIGLVASNNVHFLSDEDYEIYTILRCIDEKITLKEYNTLHKIAEQGSFASPEKMNELFKDVPEALSNTLKIANRCTAVIETVATAPAGKKYKGPVFNKKAAEKNTFRDHCLAGLKKRFPDPDPEYIDRLDEELEIIYQTGMEQYFLVAEDLIRNINESTTEDGIATGIINASLVAYALGITNVDPLEYGLIFECFIDLDSFTVPRLEIAISHKYSIMTFFKYMQKKFGGSYIEANVCSDSTVKNYRSFIGPVADVLEIESDTADPDLYTKLVRNAEKIQYCMHSLVTFMEPHFVLGHSPIEESIPLCHYRSEDSTKIESFPQFDEKSLEAMGLFQITVRKPGHIKGEEQFLKLVQQRHGISLETTSIPLYDKATFDFFCTGETAGVYQLESESSQYVLRKIKPISLENIIAFSAIFRPGPLNNGFDSVYAQRKNEGSIILYHDYILEHILEETFGLILYLEQGMRIIQKLTGKSAASSLTMLNFLRENADQVELQTIRKEFVDASAANNFDAYIAEETFADLAEAAPHLIQKARCISCALHICQSAYLRVHYPEEFFTAAINAANEESLEYKRLKKEVEKLGIALLTE